jgi:hypothetical protein
VTNFFPVADATLIESAPSNSLGAAGWFSAGATQAGNTNRGLMRFDVAGSIPPGSKITLVDLAISITKVPVEPPPENLYSVRRVFRNWGEGINPGPASFPGLGLPANPGDATWTHRFFGTTNTWAVPGGLEGVDFASFPSSTALMDEVHRYHFEQTIELINDVQFWLDHPESNFGWLLKSEEESTYLTARRFGSRELNDPDESPVLTIEYLLPPRITSVSVATNRVMLSFPVNPGVTYSVEFQTALSPGTNWQTLTNLPFIFFPTNATVFDSLTSTQRYYRMRVQY